MTKLYAVALYDAIEHVTFIEFIDAENERDAWNIAELSQDSNKITSQAVKEVPNEVQRVC